jgi:hypothetical protein
MTKDFDQWAALQGRLLALESALTQLAFRWVLTQPHPPTALSGFLRPLEEDAANMSRDPENHPDAMEAMRLTIQGMGEALEAGLHKAALLRATPDNSGRS